MNKKAILDTNTIIRFLANDSPSQAKKVEKLLKKSTKKGLEIPDLIIAEIIYVLLSVYELPKKEIIEKIRSLINFDKIKTNKKTISLSLKHYYENNISFADAYLCTKSELGNKDLYTFDKKLLQTTSHAKTP